MSAGRVAGKVAFITGAARGQGRSHALRLAAEGADIIAVDLCAQLPSVEYPLATAEDLAETARAVEDLDRRVVAVQADVRDLASLEQALSLGVAELGRLDIVAANAGILSSGSLAELGEPAWREMIDVNLSGVWRTCKAAIPYLIDGGRGGSIVLTSSVAGLKSYPNMAHYVAANAGILSSGSLAELGELAWREMIDVNLSGVWRTCKAAIPYLIEGGRGGSIVLTSSVAGLKSYPNLAHYVAAKHGVTGLARALAVELAPHRIRVNSVHPTQVDTDMIQNDVMYRLFRPDLDSPGRADFAEASRATGLLPVDWVEAADVSSALLFLASDDARYITGIALPVDAGALLT